LHLLKGNTAKQLSKEFSSKRFLIISSESDTVLRVQGRIQRTCSVVSVFPGNVASQLR